MCVCVWGGGGGVGGQERGVNNYTAICCICICSVEVWIEEGRKAS